MPCQNESKQIESILRQITYLAENLDTSIDLNRVLREAKEFLTSFNSFIPKLLGLQRHTKAAKITVLGLSGTVPYHVGAQTLHLELLVLFSSADSKRCFQLMCPTPMHRVHLITYTGEVILDFCPHIALLATVQWFIHTLEDFIMARASMDASHGLVYPDQYGLWESCELFHDMRLSAQQQANALATELGERQRAVSDGVRNARQKGEALTSTAMHLLKNMRLSLDLLSISRASAQIQSDKPADTVEPLKHTPEDGVRSKRCVSETSKLLAYLIATEDTIYDILKMYPTPHVPGFTSAALCGIKDTLGILAERALNLRFKIYLVNRNDYAANLPV